VKKLTAIALLIALSGQCLVQLGYLAWFEINRTEIALANCENKDKPEMACNGQCHAMKTLKKLEEQTSNEVPEGQIETLSIPVFLVQESVYSVPALQSEQFISHPIVASSLSEGVLAGVFKPPGDVSISV